MELTAPSALPVQCPAPIALQYNSGLCIAQGKDKGSLQDCLEQISVKEKHFWLILVKTVKFWWHICAIQYYDI